MSLQMAAEQLRQIVRAAGPAALISAALIAVWMLSRFVARLQEQRRIREHLPQIMREELEGRDRYIEELRKKLADAEEAASEYRVRLRAAAVMARKVGEIVLPTPQETEPSRLRLLEARETGAKRR